MKLLDLNSYNLYTSEYVEDKLHAMEDRFIEMEFQLNNSWLNKYVEIKDTNKSKYKKHGVVGMQGVVERLSGEHIGVRVNDKENKASQYGVYWFKSGELKIIGDRSEVYKMKFDYVAIVNLIEDCFKKDYAFGLYEEDYKILEELKVSDECIERDQFVVVNPRSKNTRVLGVVKKVMTTDEYFAIAKNKGTKITAEVIGVVNMNNHIARVEEETRLKELAKKKAAIEKELEEEINKRKSVEYYEKMAQQYADNPRLAELVAELKGLGE